MKKERTSQRSKHKQSGRRLTPAGQIQKKHIPFAQQAKQNAERLANAEQIICFAQLRAKMCEKDSREAWRSSEIMKILIFRTP